MNTSTCVDPSTQGTRPGKVRGMIFSQEYELERLVRNVENTHSSWTTATNACRWSGVTCNDAAMVDRITWDWLKLHGSMLWQHLPRTLTFFSVSPNSLEGEVDLINLPPQLEYFFVNHNQLSGRVDLSGLPSTLQVLGLRSNKFSENVYFQVVPTTLSALWLQENEELTGTLGEHELPEHTTYDFSGTKIQCWNNMKERHVTNWADGRITYRYY